MKTFFFFLTCDIDFLLSVSKVSHCLTSSPTPKTVNSLHRMRDVWMVKDESSTVANNPPRCVGLHKHTGFTHASLWRWQLGATLTGSVMVLFYSTKLFTSIFSNVCAVSSGGIDPTIVLTCNFLKVLLLYLSITMCDLMILFHYISKANSDYVKLVFLLHCVHISQLWFGVIISYWTSKEPTHLY